MHGSTREMASSLMVRNVQEVITPSYSTKAK